MTLQINNLQWNLGWYPQLTIPGVAIFAGILGAFVGLIVELLVFGLFAGLILWYWGVTEINSKSQEVIDQFYTETERSAAIGLDMNDANVYSLNYSGEDSYPLIKPSKTYESTAILVGNTSVNINMGAKLYLPKRETSSGGTNKEFYFDQITGIESHEGGGATYLEITTADGRTTELGPADQDAVNEALADMRRKTREAKS